MSYYDIQCCDHLYRNLLEQSCGNYNKGTMVYGNAKHRGRTPVLVPSLHQLIGKYLEYQSER